MKRDAAAAVQPVLSVRGLTKGFTLHLRDGLRLPVLQQLSLDVGAGDCVALSGPSGRGKSTLLRSLYGSYGIDAGSMRLRVPEGEVDLAQAEPRRILALRRERIAYVSQFLRVIPRVSALDVVAERWLEGEPAEPMDDAAHEHRLSVARMHAGRLLERLRLPRSLWNLPPANFSGGEQQRVNVARGLVRPATLLLLDEPTASLDAANRAIVVGLILEARARGAAIVGIFHDHEVRDAVATRVVELP